MPKLPQASGDDVVRLLKSLGYKVIRTKGTLSDILNKVSLWNNISKQDLLRRLK
jgi:hypothetical protein